MHKLIALTAGLSLLATSAIAQTDAGTDTTNQNTGATANQSMDDQASRDRAQANAERAGMRNVQILDRVFVVQGTTPEGETVFMIVNPPGALIGVGMPTGAGTGQSGSGQGNATGQSSGQTGGTESGGTGTDAGGSGTGNSGGATDGQNTGGSGSGSGG